MLPVSESASAVFDSGGISIIIIYYFKLLRLFWSDLCRHKVKLTSLEVNALNSNVSADNAL